MVYWIILKRGIQNEVMLVESISDHFTKTYWKVQGTLPAKYFYLIASWMQSGSQNAFWKYLTQDSLWNTEQSTVMNKHCMANNRKHSVIRPAEGPIEFCISHGGHWICYLLRTTWTSYMTLLASIRCVYYGLDEFIHCAYSFCVMERNTENRLSLYCKLPLFH